MKPTILTSISVLFTFFLLTNCGSEPASAPEEKDPQEQESKVEEVLLSQSQFDALEMEIGKVPSRNLSSIVKANGELKAPPQNEATVTAVLGANVTSIEVIEGNEVNKGQVLAYLAHPNLTRLQSDYMDAYHRLDYLEQEFKRQKKLYEEEVGSGKSFQESRSNFRTMQSQVKSLEAQLHQLGMNPKQIREGEFYERIPLKSPIDGSITKVNVKTGQYVDPQKDLFEIVNVKHIHADLMVFEKDIYRVEEGQKVRFTVESMPNTELMAEIYSVGKKFEKDPKAIHVHAEIINKTGKLIPGMYIDGRIITDSASTLAMPADAITREEDRYMVFEAIKEDEEWKFIPHYVKTGAEEDNWVGIEFIEKVKPDKQFAMNNAYYLLAEMMKREGGHAH